jgi:hypothetical protein
VATCAECGFTYDEGEALGAADAIVAAAREAAALVNEADDDEVRVRSDPATWSALEYGCHVRDVLLVQRERVLEARRTERPTFTPMGRDERVALDGYDEQDPAVVTRQLVDAADLPDAARPSVTGLRMPLADAGDAARRPPAASSSPSAAVRRAVAIEGVTRLAPQTLSGVEAQSG